MQEFTYKFNLHLKSNQIVLKLLFPSKLFGDTNIKQNEDSLSRPFVNAAPRADVRKKKKTFVNTKRKLLTFWAKF